MTEATQQIAKRLILNDAHARLGASFRDEDGWNVPARYGDPLSEYKSVRQGGAGMIDLSTRGRIRVTGTETIMFLNGLLTNDMKTLPELHWMTAVFPTVQGRLIAAVRVLRLKDEVSGKKLTPQFLLDTEAVTHQNVMRTIERFTMAGDFRVQDITEEFTQLTIQGSAASRIAAEMFGPAVAELPRDGVTDIEWRGRRLTIMRATHTGEDGFDVIIENEHAESLWNSLIDAGARPIGHDALDTLRIEAGIARHGPDMDENNVVTETNLDSAVSFTKGCYVGQEIIVRIKHRGHVAKKLTGISFEANDKINSGGVLKSTDDKDVGRLTSVTYSPRLGRPIALGYLRYEYLATGTAVKVTTDGEAQGVVHELPFIRGSWYAT